MYTKLKTKPFKGHIEHAPTFKDIDEVVNECYKTCYFSTFPYIHNNDISSRTALKRYNSGNCIAMSMYIQKQLRKKNIISYLVPATVPNKYRVKGYLDISHVALAIPMNDTKVNDTKVNDTKVYLIDPAFYFLKPTLITLDSPNRSFYGMSKNVYKPEVEDDPKKYASIDYLNLRAFKTTTPTQLNDYQHIPFQHGMMMNILNKGLPYENDDMKVERGNLLLLFEIELDNIKKEIIDTDVQLRAFLDKYFNV